MGNVEHICAPLTGGFGYITARSAGGNFKELNFMGYVDMQYTGPLWDNNVPPLNAKNLLDISHALEAVNITQDERSTLGAEATDKLGQILQKMAQGTDSKISQIQTLVNEKGDCNIITGQYIGNANGTTSLTMPFLPRLYMDSTYSNTSEQTICMHIYTGGSYLWSFNFKHNYASGVSVQCVDCIVTDKKFQFNYQTETGKTYYYIALG